MEFCQSEKVGTLKMAVMALPLKIGTCNEPQTKLSLGQSSI